MRLSKARLRDWLGLLGRSDAGELKLINAFLSLQQKLVSEARLRSFLADCLSLGAKTADEALEHFEAVLRWRQVLRNGPCASRVGHEPIYIDNHDSRRDIPPAHSGTADNAREDVLLQPAPKPHTPSARVSYRAALTAATSKKGWYNGTGSLGIPLPDPRHVWFTDLERLTQAVRSDSRPASDATKARDALGLIETAHDAYLLSLRFPAPTLHAIPNLRIARPGFSDKGNRRFAAYLNRRAERVYRQAWGVTVHLGKLRAKSRKAINGVPERICLAIPLPQIGDDPAAVGSGLFCWHRVHVNWLVDDDVALSWPLARPPAFARDEEQTLAAG